MKIVRVLPAAAIEKSRRPEPAHVLAAYLDTLPSPHSKAAMTWRLTSAAGILSPGSTAETYPWWTITHLHVQRVIAELASRKTPPATTNLTRAALRGMARTLFGLGLLASDMRQLIVDVKPVRGSRVPRRSHGLDEVELRKLFRACAKDTRATGRRDAALLAVLYGGGLRRAEASALDLGDVRGSALHVLGKGDKERNAPLGADAKAAVEEWVAARGDWPGPLFVVANKAGRLTRERLDGKAIAYAVSRRASSIEHVAPHDLRRAFITDLIDAGEPLTTAAEAAGHASVTTTARYVQTGAKKVAAAVGKLRVPFRE